MPMTVQAVYQGGVLRPVQPLPLDEGETVDVTIAKARPAMGTGPALRPPTPEEEDYIRRMKAATSLEEMFAIMDTAPPTPDDGFDIIKAINETRRLTGFRMPDPDSAGEESR